jgi:hypothetical protein
VGPAGEPGAQVDLRATLAGHRLLLVYLDSMAAVDDDIELGELASQLCRPAQWEGRRIRALNPFSVEDAAMRLEPPSSSKGQAALLGRIPIFRIAAERFGESRPKLRDRTMVDHAARRPLPNARRHR